MSTESNWLEDADQNTQATPSTALGSVAFRSDAAHQLASDLRKTRPFQTGTIIAWESVSSNGIIYSYAAVFASGHWYTTAERANTYVQPKMSHSDLINYFADRGDYIQGLRVATVFEEVAL